MKYHNTSNINFNRQDKIKHTGATRISSIAVENCYFNNLNNHSLS